ncbi:MAG: tRNA guanosine(34) transglycosylase Tgt [Endomicrobia bacterium]|nr:tRNA guanosine(34) transglycosylase Tgt [Endomicrobiia bacterium]
MNIFKITYKDKTTKARVGILKTKSVEIETPVFLPVATLGVVKTISYEELKTIGAKAFISNTYHLYFHPGVEVIKEFNGLHNFVKWDGVIFTDSGGFQVFSLRDLRKITEDGIEFKSHIDGTLHFFSPEKVIELQNIIYSDVCMCLDECVEYPVEYNYAKRSVELTTVWAKKCKEKFFHINFPDNLDYIGLNRQLLFGIIQGSIYEDLRKQSTEQLLEIGFDGYAVGGVSVGEPKELLWKIIDLVEGYLPIDVPKYVMGVGEIDDIWFCIEKGYDIMDCVLPTRNGRNGQALTSYGKVNIKNSKYSKDKSPIDIECNCFVCKNYTRSLLHHYYKSQELLVLRLMSYHNLYFIINLVNKIKQSIKEGNFLQKKREFFDKFNSQKDK